jgi:hypothetical protein
MNLAVWVVGLALLCNVIAVVMHLYRTDAGALLYINVFGCVVLGVFIAELGQ